MPYTWNEYFKISRQHHVPQGLKSYLENLALRITRNEKTLMAKLQVLRISETSRLVCEHIQGGGGG